MKSWKFVWYNNRIHSLEKNRWNIPAKCFITFNILLEYKKTYNKFSTKPLFNQKWYISKTNFAKSILLLPQSVKPTENSWHFDWFIHTCNFPGMCAAPMSISQSLKHAICIIILYILLLLEHKPELQKWKNTKIIKAKKYI